MNREIRYRKGYENQTYRGYLPEKGAESCFLGVGQTIVLVEDGMFRTHVLDNEIIWNMEMGIKVYRDIIFTRLTVCTGKI